MFKSVKSLHIHKLQLGIILSKETLLHYAVFTMILYVLLSHGLILRDRLCCDFARDLIKLDFFQAVIPTFKHHEMTFQILTGASG